MDSQYAQIPESSRTRWGLSILSVCVCCWQAVQQERNKTKQCLCNQTGFDCRFPQAPKLCILSSITSTRFFFFFASGRATGLPQLCGRLTMLPTREALQAGPAASEERRQNASRSGLRALQTGNRLTDGQTAAVTPWSSQPVSDINCILIRTAAVRLSAFTSIRLSVRRSLASANPAQRGSRPACRPSLLAGTFPGSTQASSYLHERGREKEGEARKKR